MAFRAGDIVSYLTLDTNKYIAGLNAAGAQAKVFASESATAAQKAAAAWNIFGTAGIAMTAGVTAPVVGGFAASTKAAIEFESAFAGVRKTVNASEPEYDKLNKQLLEMSRVVPKSVEGLAGIMEAGGQLGVPQAQLEKFTRTIADLSVATNLSEEAGASMLAQYANVMGMDISNIDRLGSTIVDLGNNTATTEADIVNMAQRLSGAGSILNLTNAQVMGLAATMASLGINAEAGGSAASRVLQRMLQDVRAGGDGLKVYAKTANMSEQAFAAAFGADPLEALISFIDGLALLNETGGDVYGVLEELNLSDIRITDTLLRMTGAQGQLEKNISRANEAWSENIALAKEAEQRYGTTESKIQLAKNSINGAAISIGNAFLPVVGDAADGVADLANKFADLEEEQQKSIITQAGVAAAIGPAMMLIKGLVGVLSGPGGLVIAAGLGAAALVGLSAGIEADTFARMAKDFGDVTLSAEELDDVIKAGFGKPAIDTTGLKTARDDAENARAKLVELQQQLEKDVYLLRMGVENMTPEEIDTQVGGIITAAQTYLNLEENAARMTIKAYFGPDDKGTGAAMLGDLDGFMAGAREEMAAKGKELGDALKGAIADGQISAEEEKIIANLQNELAEIATRGALMKSQAERDLLIANAQRNGLSVQSIRDGNQALIKYADTLRSDMENERELMITLASNLKSAGAMSETEYAARVKGIEYRYRDVDADIDMSMLDTMWEMYGNQLAGTFAPKISGVKERFSVPGFDIWGSDYEGAESRDYINTASKEADTWMREMQPVLVTLEKMRAEMGGNMPAKYQSMLDFFSEMQALAEMDMDKLRPQGAPDTSAADAAAEAAKQQVEKTTEAAKEAATQGAKETVQAYGKAANQAAEDEEVHIYDTLTDPPPQLKQDMIQTGQDAVKTLVDSANTSAEEEEVHIQDTLTNPLSTLPGELGAIATNAVDAFVSKIEAGEDRAYKAGAKLGGGAGRGAAASLEIRSPSRVMTRLADNVTSTTANRIEAGIPKVQRISEAFGSAISSGYSNGYVDTVNNGRVHRPLESNSSLVEDTLARISGMGYIPGDVWTAMDPPKKQTGGGGGGGGNKAAPAPDYSAGINATMARVSQEQANLRAAINGYDAEYQRMLELTGSWRPYYDETELDQRVNAIENKYKALIDAEQAGYDALSQEEQQARSQAHSQLMAQLQENQREEISSIQQNYKLQQQLGSDFLASVSSSLSADFAAKQEGARAEDYEKNVADLEKQIRQTRSARERRELTEELERLQRDEALRLEQQQLNDTLAGINALNKALGAGVIGLGDLLADPTLQTGTGGLGAVQGITAEQLESVLQAMADRQAAGGTQYSIDLSGAVIRDDSDIDRIIDGFEERMRSIQRDMWR